MDVEGFGACGGLLVVNPIGRPIEFHCTAPVSANRTQEILYGKSLQSFLYCEQIGRTLLDQAKTKIDMVVTDQDTMVDLKLSSQQTLVVLIDKSELDESHPRLSDATEIELDEENAFAAFAFQEDRQLIKAAAHCLNQFNLTLPLDEPFERIEHAIDEAQAVAR